MKNDTTIEIMLLDHATLIRDAIVMDADGEVLARRTFRDDEYLAACRWAKRMCRLHGGTIIDHTPLAPR